MKEDIRQLEKELAASREKMECGHPKMFSKRVMRLRANSAYPNFVETHIEDDWCVKSRCEPVYICGCAGTHREDQPAHSNQLMTACTLCAELAATRAECYERAAEVADATMRNEFIKGHAESQGLRAEIVIKYTRRAIRALIPPSDAAAREDWIRRIRLEEALLWKAHRPGDGFYDRRVNELQALVPAEGDTNAK